MNEDPEKLFLTADMVADLQLLHEISGYNKVAIVSRLIRKAVEEVLVDARPKLIEKLEGDQ